jgi:acyl-CoA synthetase (NDP forming)
MTGNPSNRLIPVEDIDGLLNPSGVAFVGRIDDNPDQIKRAHRFGLPICYVNPKPRPTPSGDSVYASLAEVPDGYDLAIIRTGAAGIPAIVEDCAARGIRKIIVFSDGFGETGPEGRAHEARLADVIRRTGVLVIGPNTADNSLETFALPEGHRGGLIGLISHSGGQGRAVIEGMAIGAGFSRWVALGNEVGVDLADMINYFAHDPRTAVIAAYVEGIKSGPKLRAALRAANEHNKPVVMLKIGTSKKGREMAASHTGHISGADAPVNGLFDQFGVTRVHDIDELVETANLFAKMPAGTGTRVLALSYSGANIAIMSEVAESFGIEIPVLAESTQEAVRAILPPHLRVSNPIDSGGVISMTQPMETRLKVIDTAAADPATDVVVFGISAALPVPGGYFAEELKAWAPRGRKPALVVYSSPQWQSPSFERAVLSGAAVFRSFRGCFQALAAYARYQRISAHFRERISLARPLSAGAKAALAGPGILSAGDATRLLREAGIAVAKEEFVQSAAEARAAAADIGFPVAMKLMSAAFPHKSDVGLLALGVATAEQVATVHDELMARANALDPSAGIDGVLIQEQVAAGVEMIVGLTNDPVMGPSLTIGAGGIYAEILSDVAVRPLPVDERDVAEMIDGLKVAPLLEGARGARPADKQAFIRLVLGVAGMAESADGAISELDLNPVVVQPGRAVAVDALIVSAGSTAGAPSGQRAELEQEL